MKFLKHAALSAATPLAIALSIGSASAQITADELAGDMFIINDCAIECGFPLIETQEQGIAWLSQMAALDGNGSGNGATAGAGGSPGGAAGPSGIGLGLGLGLNAPQVVYLNFQPGEPTYRFVIPDSGIDISGTDYEYTDEDKAEIIDRLEADYGAYNFDFVLERPTQGDFVELQFNSNDAPGAGTAGVLPNGGILFGQAGELDFGNDSRSVVAINDATVWLFFTQLDVLQGLPAGARLEVFAGIDIIGLPFITDGLDAVPLNQALRTAIINQTANTGAHELGHTLGLRHYDAFGPIGGGLPDTGVPEPTEFLPFYTNGQNADETTLHLMSSGASSGLSLAGSGNQDRFHSERSAIKLAINERGRFVTDAQANSGQASLKKLQVINPILEGDNAGGRLDVRNVIVEGRIDLFDEIDTLTFDGKAGQIFNAEMISLVEAGTYFDWDLMIGTLELYLENPNGTRTFVARNDAEFESFDAFMLDVTLPENGRYTLEMSSPDSICLAECGTENALIVPLNFGGPAGELFFRIGQYITNVYIVESKNGKGPKKIGGPKK
ncbi:MAG: hypothetical protein AAFV59_17000 [Pseudomonadota bacterium]